MNSTRTLRKHEKVALLSPASPFRDPALLKTSVEALEQLGLVPVVYPGATGGEGYLAAPDAVRAEDLMHAFCDDEIAAIFCTRGGYGCTRILPLLDYEEISRHKKKVIGLSDITALQLALYKKAGVQCLHAPMPFRYPALPLGAKSRLVSMLFSPTPTVYTAEDGLVSLRNGRTQGRMLGGNLSLVCAMLASDYLPDFENCILFLEEIGEEPYRVDRLLTSLHLSGVFSRVKGIVFGGFTDCGEERLIRAVLSDRTPKNIPTLCGFPAGHLLNNHAFLQGQYVTLNCDECTLTL